jgi:2'-5' RNA ligase
MHFLLLEFDDKDINDYISKLISIIQGDAPRFKPHLTVRGPYTNKIDKKIITKCQKMMEFDVLKIHGVGKFTNKNEVVVYLRVDSSNLRNIWWKPHFPKSKSFEPHISLYRGDNIDLANRIYNFLFTNAVEFNCKEFSLVEHISKNYRLLALDDERINYQSRFSITNQIDEEYFVRFREAIHSN